MTGVERSRCPQWNINNCRDKEKRGKKDNGFFACLHQPAFYSKTFLLTIPCYISLSFWLFSSPCVFCIPCHFLCDLFSSLHTYSKLLFLNQLWHTFLKPLLFFPMLCFSILNALLLHIFPLPHNYKKLLFFYSFEIVFFLYPLILIIYCLKSRITLGLLPSLTATCCHLLTYFSCTHSIKSRMLQKSFLFQNQSSAPLSVVFVPLDSSPRPNTSHPQMVVNTQVVHS